MTRAVASALPGGPTRRFATDALLRNSLAMMTTTVVTSLFGYAFWLVVARIYPAGVSGAGAAVTSALQATALCASVGAAAAMVEWLPRCSSRLEFRRRFAVGLVVAATGAVLGSALVVAVLGHATGTLPALGTPIGGLVFGLGTVFFAVGIVIDYAAVAQRSAALMLGRNTLFVALRIPVVLLPALLPGTGDQILTAWALAGGLSLSAACAGFRGGTYGRRPWPAFDGLATHLREMRNSLLGQHFITLASMLGSYLLPVIVVARVSATADAYFFATWMLGAAFFMISPAVSTALFAATSSDPAAIAAAVRRSAILIACLLVVPMGAALFGGGLLLSLFGPAYPGEGRVLLILLTLSAVPDAVTNVAVAVLRATSRLRAALVLNTAMLAAGVGLSWALLPHLGIVAVGVSWLAAQTAGALWVAARWAPAGWLRRVPG